MILRIQITVIEGKKEKVSLPSARTGVGKDLKKRFPGSFIELSANRYVSPLKK